MKWFWRKNKNKDEQKTNEIQPPQSSYDLYNDGKTGQLNIGENQENDLTVAYNIDDMQKSKKTTKTKKCSTTTNTKEVKKEGRNIYYVSARKDKDGKKLGWEVKKENAEKITKLCSTKDEAIDFVKEKAGNQGSTCIIRKMDGTIERTLKFSDK